MTAALTHSDVSKLINADLSLWNYVMKCPTATLIQPQQVAHNHCVRRTGIRRQPQHSRLGGSTSVTVQSAVSQCTPWRHTACCSSRWPCSQHQQGRLPDRTGRSVSMPRDVRDGTVGIAPVCCHLHNIQSGSGATQPPTE